MSDDQNAAGARHSHRDKTLFSGWNDPGGDTLSPKTVAASWNETRCFRRFCLALPESHSKFTTCRSKEQSLPGLPWARGMDDRWRKSLVDWRSFEEFETENTKTIFGRGCRFGGRGIGLCGR
jgi:hypothetical protein